MVGTGLRHQRDKVGVIIPPGDLENGLHARLTGEFMNRGKGRLHLVVGILRQQVECDHQRFITAFGHASPIDAQQLMSQPLEEVLQQSIGRHTQHLADRKMSSHRCHLIRDTRFAYHLLVWWVPPTCSWVAGVPASSGSVREPPAQRRTQLLQAGGLLSGQKQQVESWGARRCERFWPSASRESLADYADANASTD